MIVTVKALGMSVITPVEAKSVLIVAGMSVVMVLFTIVVIVEKDAARGRM